MLKMKAVYANDQEVVFYATEEALEELQRKAKQAGSYNNVWITAGSQGFSTGGLRAIVRDVT